MGNEALQCKLEVSCSTSSALGVVKLSGPCIDRNDGNMSNVSWLAKKRGCEDLRGQ